MRRMMALLLCTIVLVSLSACGNGVARVQGAPAQPDSTALREPQSYVESKELHSQRSVMPPATEPRTPASADVQQAQPPGVPPLPVAPQTPPRDTPTMPQITITIDGTVYTATLEENETAHAFARLLPLTLEMGELNQNEKFDYLADDLPTSPVHPGQIQTGDLLLFGSDCLVLFYEDFSSGYQYTRIGRVENPTGLAAAVGPGSVTITFSPQEPSVAEGE